jgi:hypothetical protein
MKNSVRMIFFFFLGLWLWHGPLSSPISENKHPRMAQVGAIKTAERTPKSHPQTAPEMGSKTTPLARRPAQSQLTRGTLPLNLEEESHLALDGRDHVMLEISAIPRDQYRPEMGGKISENRRLVFFRSPVVSDKTFPVAYDESRQKLYPIVSILHLRQIDESVRAEVLGQGLREYYYHPGLKYLAVESTSTRVLGQYEALKSKGFKVRLEILKEGVRPN